MAFRGGLASIAAAALLAAPVAAQAAPVREAAPVQGEELGGSPWITIAFVFAVLAAMLLVVGNSDNPHSP